MANNSDESNIHERLPEITKGEGAEVWRDVLEFKVQQQQSALERNVGNGNGGKPSGSWEMVGCSHASECGSTARTLPGSEFGLIDDASDCADLTPEFQETHSRVLAEIEAQEAAERNALGSTNIHGSQTLPVSTHTGLLHVSDEHICVDSSGTTAGGSVPSRAQGSITIPALEGDDGLEVHVLADDVDPTIEICSVEELDGYCSNEDVQGLVAGHTSPASRSREALRGLQELCREEPAGGSTYLDSGSAKDSGGSERPLKGIESFEEVRSAEGAFSELSFDSPTAPRDGAQQKVATERLLSTGSGLVEVQQVENPLEVRPELSGGTCWLTPRMQHLFQRWTTLVVDLLPRGGVQRSTSVAKTAAGHFDWKGIAFNAGLALLSSLVVGLFIQNRRLGFEVRRKHEEISRMMKTLANFQELWSSHRMGKVPILRHTNFDPMAPHCPI